MGAQTGITGHTGHAGLVANPSVTCQGRAQGCHSQQPQLVPESHSQALLQLRVHLGRCLLLAQGPAEELGPGRPRWWQHNRVAGAARGSRSSWHFPGSAPSAAARARCWVQGMHQGCLQGGSGSQPSNHPTLPPTLCSLQPSDPAPAPQNPPFRLHAPSETTMPTPPCPPWPAPAHTVLTLQGWLSPLTSPTVPTLPLCVSQECFPNTAQPTRSPAIPCAVRSPLSPHVCAHVPITLYPHLTRNRLTPDLDTEQHCRRNRGKIFIIQTIQPPQSHCHPCPTHTALVSFLGPGPLWPPGDFLHPRAAQGTEPESHTGIRVCHRH